jgi:putative DNA primase/helicase
VSQFERDLRIAMLQEYTGICLIGEAPKFQRCLIVFATGGNGKSELLHILRGLFPPDAQTSLVPQWWGNQFRSVMLEGKLANFCDELPDAEIMGGESWKLVITGEPIPMERKHKDAFMFPCTAGHIFCTNTAIRTTDHSVGFWRRPLALSLTRKFEDDPGRILEAGRRVLEAEHAGIVAWAIHGAARAQLQRGYTMPPSSHELVTEWRDENDQVRGYFLDHPLRDRISASDLYRQYVTWAKESGLGPMSITMFGRRIMAAELADRIKDGKSWYQPKGMNAAQRAEMANRAALEAERERMNCG